MYLVLERASKNGSNFKGYDQNTYSYRNCDYLSDIPVFQIFLVLVCIKFNIKHLSISFYIVFNTISVQVSI